MSFLFPLGLLGLIGVPVLIAIYIIKNKYTEQVITSTYLWTLSEKFLKRRNPINKLAGIISLILQIAVVCAISLGVAHPVFIIPNSAYDYCFVMDVSGSMNIVENGETRIEKGKKQIENLINSSSNGSYYTLVTVGEDEQVIFEKFTNKKQAISMLSEITPCYSATDITKASQTVQNYFDEDSALDIYLITDKTFGTTTLAKTIFIAEENTQNYAVTSLDYTLVDSTLKIQGEVVSYGKDANIPLSLYLNGDDESFIDLDISLIDGECTPFTLEKKMGEIPFLSVKAKVAEGDAFAPDNERVAYNLQYQNSYKTLLVSEKPFFMQSVLKVVGNAQVEVITDLAKAEGKTGYGLYVFEGFTPQVLPKDGAIMFINPTSSVADSGFTVQGTKSLSRAGKLSYSRASSSLLKSLTASVVKDDIYLSAFVKCGLYRSFTTVLSYDGNPMLFAGTNAYGNRQTVFAFDLHDSNLPILTDFTTLTNNALKYMFPDVIDGTAYNCGDVATLNVLNNMDVKKVLSPDGKEIFPVVIDSLATFKVDEVGTYTVEVSVGGTDKTYYIYSAFPAEESVVYPSSQTDFLIFGVATQDPLDGLYESLLALFIILALLFLADWMVYCYEQYQLR